MINSAKASAMKQQILTKYPESRYAQIISNDGLNAQQLSQTPEAKYKGLYEKYEENTNVAVLDEVESAVDLYTGEEIVSKYELLKANILGKLKGVEEYKKALNFVALNYPNSLEGKTAETLLAKDIPYLQKLKFNGEKATSWKLIFNIVDTINAHDSAVIDKIKKFTSERTAEKLSFSVDTYYMDDILLVVHGIPSESKAQDIVTILKDYKDYKIADTAIIVSAENYKVMQIQKNLDVFLKSQSEVNTESETELKVEEMPEVKEELKEELKAKVAPQVKNLQSKSEVKTEQLNLLQEINETAVPAKKQ
jgi:hypothetical protein